MESERSAQVTAPEWVGLVLNPAPDQNLSPDVDNVGQDRTVRGEFVRRVGRALLEADEGPVLRAGLLALDGRLTVREGGQ